MRRRTYEVHPHIQKAERRPSRLFHIAMSVHSEPREAQRRPQLS